MSRNNQKAISRRIKAERLRGCILVSILVVSCSCACKAGGQEKDKTTASRWVEAKFEGHTTPLAERGYLSGSFEKGRLAKTRRHGLPLRIAGEQFAHGVNCPSTGTLHVHLPVPALRFHALIGVDSNDLTYYSSLGRGSVSISLDVNGKKAFQSLVMHEGMKAVPMDADLGGATDFALHITAEKHDWDQIDLAEATVALKNGGEIRLDDLPIGPLPGSPSSDPPFSFTYGGTASVEFLKHWRLVRSSRRLDDWRTEYTNIYEDSKTGLQVRCVGVAYDDFPTVEWVVYFKNKGTQDSSILEGIRSVDTRFERSGDAEFILHHNKGSSAVPNDYEPYETTLGPGASIELGAAGGRSSNKDLPYFNLESPGGGTIVAVGWPGQWSATLSRDSSHGIQLRAGQQLTHFKLQPGEEVRTPLTVIQFWSGDRLQAQNTWRHWMMAHNIPLQNGKPPATQLAANTSREFAEMQEATDRDENHFIDLYLQNDIHPDYFWMDAGWYPDGGSWLNTGTWEVDTQRFPKGLRAVSDHAHASQVKTIVWFEPERVTKGSWLYEHHPEWLLAAPAKHDDQLYDPEWRLLNLGNDEARRWLTNHVDDLIVSQGIDLYRQDFNLDPLYFWRANDSPDRQGITEIRYVTGYLAYWDELRRRHPNMLIDSCASGGRRNDVESLRRAVPLTRSDYLLEPEEPISQQMQTYGMASWIPYFGTGVSGANEYVFRSQMTPALVTTWDLRRAGVDAKEIRRLVLQWRSIAANYLGDYYPLTPYSLDRTAWAAMQFGQPSGQRGFVEAFRRSASPYETVRLPLHGLDPKATYHVNDLDSSKTFRASGESLMGDGLEIKLSTAPASALLSYEMEANPK